MPSPKTDAVRDALLSQYRRKKPKKNKPSMQEVFLNWLARWKFPGDPNAKDWSGTLKEFPVDPDKPVAQEGLRMNFALRLQTESNRYLISVLECLDADSRGVYILTAHVNWDDKEFKVQQALDNGYKDGFIDVLRARHTVWAQTLRRDELADALDAAAVAILGYELRPVSEPPESGQTFTMPHPTPLHILDDDS